MIITKSKFSITVSFTLLFCMIFTNVGTCGETDGNILYVDDDGTMDHISIQDAIDEASDGDIIFVNNGIYTGPIVIIKQIKLTGLEKPIINEYIEGGTTISISADNVTLDGFILQNNNMNHAKGVHITSNNNIITNCSIKNYFRGIYLYNSHNNIIQDNIIENSKLDGIDLIESDFNNIQRNDITNTTIYGINLWNANYNHIEENTIENNQESGVYFSSSSNNSFIKNLVLENKLVGLSLNIDSNNNLLFYNNFVNNSIQVEDNCLNIWYDQKTKMGNYWNNYLILNPDVSQKDGTWSEPFNISSDGAIQDIYPLVELYEKIDIQTDDPVNNNLGGMDENNLIYLPLILIILPVIFFFWVIWNKKRKR